LSGGRPIERRRIKRTPAERLARAASVVGAQLLDLSPLGMRITSPVPMESQAVLPFRLVLDGEKHDVRARVVSCGRARGGGARYTVGLEFSDLPAAVRARLVQVLEAAARESAPIAGS
jgi:hypothetical protein